MEKLILGRSYGQPISVRFLNDGTYRLDYKDLDDDYPGIREIWIHYHAANSWDLGAYISEVFGDEMMSRYALNWVRVASRGMINPEHMAKRQKRRAHR